MTASSVSTGDRLSVAWARNGVPMWEAWDLEVTRQEALDEIDRHDVEGGRDAFLAEVGDRPQFMGHEVLEWLGY